MYAGSINYLTDRPSKILLSVCLPLVIVNVFLAFTTTVTNQFYSRFIGQDAFTVTGYLNAVTTAFANIVASVMTAAWIKTAHNFTMGRKDICAQHIFHGILAITVVDIALALLLLLFHAPILVILHVPDAIYAASRTYLILYILCYLPVPVAGLLLTIVNGTGSSLRLLWVNVVVVLLNFIAVVLLLAVCNAGIVGLALCACLGAILQLIFDGLLFRTDGFCFPLRQMLQNADWSIVREMICYGLLIALQNLLCTSGYLLTTFQTNRYLSMEYISVLNVSLPLTGIMSAFGSACLAFCPQNCGARKMERLREFLRLSTACSVLYGIFCFLLYALLGRRYYEGLFVQPEIIALGAEFWVWQGLGYIFLSLLYTLRSFFDSVGMSRLSLLSGLGELCGNGICAVWVIPQFGNIGRSLAYPAGWFLASLLLICAFVSNRKRIFSAERTPKRVPSGL